MVKKILIVGSGGIGCELVKLLYNLEETGITLIDLDYIELSNLNRQFLFTENDVKKSKSMVTSNAIIKKHPSWNIKYLYDSIYNYGKEFFKQYDLVYNCLDNNEARSYVNVRCFLSKVKLIDGGSGGYKGQSYVFTYENECFDCLPKVVQRNYNVCTVRSSPTKFEHCIEYVKIVLFEEVHNPLNLKKMQYYKKYIKKRIEVNKLKIDDAYNSEIKKIVKLIKSIFDRRKGKISDDSNIKKTKIEETGSVISLIEWDKEDKEVLKLLYKLSCIRARSVKIPVLSMFETETIANKIISSVCTTNSIVASLMMLSTENLQNYFLTSNKKILTKISPFEKNPECLTCSKNWIVMKYKEDITVIELFQFLDRQFKCKFLIDDEGNYYSYLPYNLDTSITIKNNSVYTLGYKDSETSDVIKIYFEEKHEEMKIIENISNR